SAEFDYLVKGNFGLAAFVDAGDATDRLFESFKVGAGLGLRYRSPVGMLRLDIAHPFDDPDSDYRIHISFGIDL
ncbi:MAG: translocation and assembly module TamA, partial [Halioglobus sp.]